MAKTELETRTKEFALNLIDLVSRMPRNRAGDVVAEQLLRSGTSIGVTTVKRRERSLRPTSCTSLGFRLRNPQKPNFG
jgi:hypothetical protein